jgi:hypothetical protein
VVPQNETTFEYDIKGVAEPIGHIGERSSKSLIHQVEREVSSYLLENVCDFFA